MSPDAAGWLLVREFNIALVVLGLAAMVWRLGYFRRQERPVQLVLAAAGGMLASLGYASLDILLSGRPVPGGTRLLVITVALSLFLIALVFAQPLWLPRWTPAWLRARLGGTPGDRKQPRRAS